MERDQARHRVSARDNTIVLGEARGVLRDPQLDTVDKLVKVYVIVSFAFFPRPDTMQRINSMVRDLGGALAGLDNDADRLRQIMDTIGSVTDDAGDAPPDPTKVLLSMRATITSLLRHYAFEELPLDHSLNADQAMEYAERVTYRIRARLSQIFCPEMSAAPPAINSRTFYVSSQEVTGGVRMAAVRISTRDRAASNPRALHMGIMELPETSRQTIVAEIRRVLNQDNIDHVVVLIHVYLVLNIIALPGDVQEQRYYSDFMDQLRRMNSDYERMGNVFNKVKVAAFDEDLSTGESLFHMKLFLELLFNYFNWETPPEDSRALKTYKENLVIRIKRHLLATLGEDPSQAQTTCIIFQVVANAEAQPGDEEPPTGQPASPATPPTTQVETPASSFTPFSGKGMRLNEVVTDGAACAAEPQAPRPTTDFEKELQEAVKDVSDPFEMKLILDAFFYEDSDSEECQLDKMD